MKVLVEEPYFDRENNEANFQRHMDKHVRGVGDNPDPPYLLFKGLSEEEYDVLANNISNSPAGPLHSSAYVVGYVAKNGMKVKIIPSQNILVAYLDDQAITLYRLRPNWQTRLLFDKQLGYDKELPENERLGKLIDKIGDEIELQFQDIDESINLDYLLEAAQRTNYVYNELYGKDSEVQVNNIKKINSLRK